jgi:pyruvate formate lyase activating enzyme
VPTLIVDIRRNSLDDGPGIRSTVFFKGCVLSCVWCQNPETLSPKREIQHHAGNCIACGTCVDNCPHGALTLVAGAREYDRERCQLCGTCVENCPAGAVRFVGREVSVDELVAELVKDEPFYRNSGGGVTFSGGEPTIHTDYVAEVAEKLQNRGVHTLLQTCGLYKTAAVEDKLLPHIDTIYFDTKIADPERHARYTGVSNEAILANLARLADFARERVLPRVPLVPGITDTDDNLAGIAEIVTGFGFGKIALLPYNPLWISKRAELGMDFAYRHEEFMPEEEVTRCRAVMKRRGLEVL